MKLTIRMTSVLLVGACATSPGSSPTALPPAWLEAPNPEIQAFDRCYHGQASEQNSVEQALTAARRQAVARIVGDVQTTVQTASVALQAEADGRYSVWVGERVVQQAVGAVWGVVEQDRWTVASGASWSAHVRLCLPQATYTEMRAALVEQQERVARLATTELEAALGELAKPHPLAVPPHLSLAAGAAAALPVGPRRREFDNRIAALRLRLASGLAIGVHNEAPSLPVAPLAQATLATQVSFEGQVLAGAQVSWRLDPTGPWRLAGTSDAQGVVLIALGPMDTTSDSSVSVELRAQLEQVPSVQTTVTLSTRFDPRSVIVCPAVTPGGMTAVLVRQMPLERLRLVDAEYCDRAAAMARYRIDLTAPGPSCKRAFGDWDCQVRLSATLTDQTHGRRLTTAHGRGAFVHPDRATAARAASRKAIAAVHRGLRGPLTRVGLEQP